MVTPAHSHDGDRRLVRDVLLRDGSTLRLRAPAAEDLDDLREFYDRLSPESRYMRFHGYGRTDLAARMYAEADGEDRVALVGRHGGRIVAAAGYDRLREPGAAEVAFTVADDYRRRGAATRLLEQLAAIAAERGIRRFDAEVLTENRAMLGVFRRAGFALRRRGAMGEVTVSLDITPTREVLQRIDERDHVAAVASLRPLLAPVSVAVIGAAGTAGNIGSELLARLVEGDFQGVVEPVDGAGGVVRSLRAARTVGELAEAPELAIVAAPSADVLEAAAQAVEAGCRGLLVLGSDTAAAGDDAPRRMERLLDLVRGAGARLLGPGSLGVLNTDPAVNLHASPVAAPVTAGRLAICSQSGAIGIGLLGHAVARRLGVSAFVSLGQRVDVSTNDLLEFWEEDERTAAVLLYVETFGNPDRFARIARRVSRRKPILAIAPHPPGRPRPAGRSPAESHTAAALRDGAAVDAMLRQAGVMRFPSGDALVNAAEFFESQPLPNGRRVAIVSNSAGVATLARDACANRDLLVSELGHRVEAFDPTGYGGPRAQNPTILPVGAAPDRYASAVRRLLAEHDVDAVMAHFVDLAGVDPAEVLAAVARGASGLAKPVVASILGADGRLPEPPPLTVPNFAFPEACAAVIARAAERREWLSRPLGQAQPLTGLDGAGARALVDGWLTGDGGGAGDAGRWLSVGESERLLATHGIPVVAARACRSPAAAVAAAAQIGGPVALKADYPPPAHASDVDAVLLGLHGEGAVTAGWEELRRRTQAAGREWRGVLVQPLAGAGADVLVGTVRDPDLGPVVAVGLGGRQAGLAAAAAFRMPPRTDVDADELLAGAPGVRAQLDGFRGQPPLDHEALRALVLRFAELLRAVPEILEADLNPTRVTVDDCQVLDMRIRIGRRRAPERTKTW